MADTTVHQPAQWQPMAAQPAIGRAPAQPLSRARTHATQRSDAQQSQFAQQQPSIPSSASFANYAPLYRASSSILTRQLTTRRSASPLRRIGSRRVSTVARIRRFFHRFSWNRRVKAYPYGKAHLQRQASFVVTPDRSSYNYGYKSKDLVRRKPKPRFWRSPQPVAAWKNSRPMDVLLNNGMVAELPPHLASPARRAVETASPRVQNSLVGRRETRGRPLPKTFEPPPSTPVGGAATTLIDPLAGASHEQPQSTEERGHQHLDSYPAPDEQRYASRGEPKGPAPTRQPQYPQQRLQAWPKISLPVKHTSSSSDAVNTSAGANDSSTQSPNNTVDSERSGRSGLDAITQTPLVDLGGPNESRFAGDPEAVAALSLPRVRGDTASSASPLSRRAVSAIQPRASAPGDASGALRERPLSMPAQPRSHSSRALARTVSTPPDSPTAVASSYRPESWRRSAIMVRGIRDSQVEDLIDLQDNSDFVGVWSIYIQRAIAQRAIDSREKRDREEKNERRWSQNLGWDSDSDRVSALTSTHDDASSESSSVAESSTPSTHSSNDSTGSSTGGSIGGGRSIPRGHGGGGKSNLPHKTPPNSPPPKRPNQESPGSIYSSDPPATPTAITRDSHIRATTYEPGTPRELSTSKLAPLYSPRQMACASVTALALTGQTLASPPALSRAALEEMPTKFSTLFSIRHSSWQPEDSVTSLTDLDSNGSSATNLNAPVYVLSPDSARSSRAAATPEVAPETKTPSGSPLYAFPSLPTDADFTPPSAATIETVTAGATDAPANAATPRVSASEVFREHPACLAPPSIISVGSRNPHEVDFDFSDTASTSRKRPLPQSPLNTPPDSPATPAVDSADLPLTLASTSTLALTEPTRPLLVANRPVSSSISLELSPSGATEDAPALVRSQTHRQPQTKRVRSSVSREALIHTRQKTMESLWGGEDESDDVSS